MLSCFRLLIHVILGTRVGILVNTSLHARLSSNFRGADTFTTSIIGVSGLIVEKHIVVVVVFGLNRRHFLFITKRKFGCIFILDIVFILVGRCGTASTHVFLNGQCAKEDFFLVCTAGF